MKSQVLEMEKPPLGSEDSLDLERTVSPRTRRRSSCLAAVVVLSTLILVAGTAAAVFLYNRLQRKEKFVAVSSVGGQRIPEHVRVDFINKIIYVSNRQEGEVDGLVALHAYDRGMLALRDLTSQKCYIDRLDDSFDDGFSFWSSQEGRERTPKRQYFRYVIEPIDKDVLRTFGGKFVAEHCNDVPSHWIVTIPENAIPDEVEAIKNKTAEFICRPNIVVLNQ